MGFVALTTCLHSHVAHEYQVFFEPKYSRPHVKQCGGKTRIYYWIPKLWISNTENSSVNFSREKKNLYKYDKQQIEWTNEQSVRCAEW